MIFFSEVCFNFHSSFSIATALMASFVISCQAHGSQTLHFGAQKALQRTHRCSKSCLQILKKTQQLTNFPHRSSSFSKLHFYIPSNNTVFLQSRVFGSCYNKEQEQVPCKNIYGTWKGEGSVQSDSKVWEVVQYPTQVLNCWDIHLF